MQSDFQNQVITLEAPGDFLSELLGVTEAAVLELNGGVRELPVRSGWHVLTPLVGTLRVAYGEMSLPLESGNALVVCGPEDTSLLSSEICTLGLLTLCGNAADRVFTESSNHGGLFFERGGVAAARMLRLLSEGYPGIRFEVCLISLDRGRAFADRIEEEPEPGLLHVAFDYADHTPGVPDFTVRRTSIRKR